MLPKKKRTPEELFLKNVSIKKETEDFAFLLVINGAYFVLISLIFGLLTGMAVGLWVASKLF